MTHKLLTIIELHPNLSQLAIEKGKITVRYLKSKVHEYENLRNQIGKLRQEVSASSYESQKQLTEADLVWNPTR